ncbi:hypothetical protein D0Y83_14780 [Qipengyuania flava]|uniref:Uncharacterized protein n=1 Tax=Qipengyuania flava TaxID=192812 RepID=A0A5P6NEK6_9SPHN|nr:hypothetical protein [Qipengyuania flava]OAN82630.1 hypothetical protein A8B77_12120 [Erythrobacter sp. EhN03]QFI64385.1 hypothetical protein D0Y83_14780 [Qipengyuania flava]HCS17591.1 hypothetical protein [Erythrobacter sp.]
MIPRATSGWQTITADLALILFLITAQAVAEPHEPETAPTTDTPPPDSTAALAMHRPARGENISEWLAASVSDERQVATIAIDYAPGERNIALTEGTRLLGNADAARVTARLVLAPAARNATLVSIDYLREGEAGTDLAQ